MPLRSRASNSAPSYSLPFFFFCQTDCSLLTKPHSPLLLPSFYFASSLPLYYNVQYNVKQLHLWMLEKVSFWIHSAGTSRGVAHKNQRGFSLSPLKLQLFTGAYQTWFWNSFWCNYTPVLTLKFPFSKTTVVLSFKLLWRNTTTESYIFISVF